MKLSVSLLLLITILFLNLTSCQKEVADPNGSTNVSGDFTAKVNGVQFVANKLTSAAKLNGVIVVVGAAKDGQQIVLRVADSGVHVYSLDINSFSNAGAYQTDSISAAFVTNQGSTPAQSGGSLSVTAIDAVRHTISGTFTMNVFRQLDASQKTITEGVFNNIHYDTSAAPAATTDTFRVKVDGVDFPTFSVFGISVFGRINVTGSDQALLKTVGLSFDSSTVPGTYPMDQLTTIGQYNLNSTTFLVSNTGSLTILENNIATKRIRGNFNFHAQPFLTPPPPEATLTAGYFSVKYQ